jgi:hypothetical protein
MHPLEVVFYRHEVGAGFFWTTHMMTALECRRQSVRYMDQARLEDNAEIRAALLGLNRSYLTIANQMDRLADLLDAEGRVLGLRPRRFRETNVRTTDKQPNP